jgi:hypothetical protein
MKKNIILIFIIINFQSFAQLSNYQYTINLTNRSFIDTLEMEDAQLFISCIDYPSIYCLPNVKYIYSDSNITDTIICLITLNISFHNDSLFNLKVDSVDIEFLSMNYQNIKYLSEEKKIETIIKNHFFSSLSNVKFYSTKIYNYKCTAYFPIKIIPKI